MKELFLLLKNKLLEIVKFIAGNEIQVIESGYNGKQIISVGATNSFTYTLSKVPEKASYISTDSVLTYKIFFRISIWSCSGI